MPNLPSLAEATPMMRQYLEIKQNYPDTLDLVTSTSFFTMMQKKSSLFWI